MIPNDEDFASLFAAQQNKDLARSARGLKVGQQVQGQVIAIGKDSVFVDIGIKAEARISKDQLVDKRGRLTVAVGDLIRATVAKAHGPDGPELIQSLGRNHAINLAAIELAYQQGTTLEGKVTAVTKGGLEVEIGDIKAFCPASQADLSYMASLDHFVGQNLLFKVIELRDGGRSAILSRKEALKQERQEKAETLRKQLKVGADLEGTVQSIQSYGAFVDLGGVEGLVHISEIAPGRVENIRDVLQVGETVKVRVLAIDAPAGKADDLKISLSIKAIEQPIRGEESQQVEIMEGTVSQVNSFGVFVDTEQGRGLVPIRELDLPPGGDPRRVYPLGKQVKVVLLSRDSKTGKVRYSIRGVAAAEERSNYRQFHQGKEGPKKQNFGLLGDLLKEKLPEEAWTPKTSKTTRKQSTSQPPTSQEKAPSTSKATQSKRRHVR